MTLAVSKLFRSLTTAAEGNTKSDLQSKYNFYSWVQPVVSLKDIYFSLRWEKHRLAFFRTLGIKHSIIKGTHFIFQSQMVFPIKTTGDYCSAIKFGGLCPYPHIIPYLFLYSSRRQDSSTGSSVWWEYEYARIFSMLFDREQQSLNILYSGKYWHTFEFNSGFFFFKIGLHH